MDGPSVRKKLSRYIRPSPLVKVRLTQRRQALLRTTLEYRIINREIAQLRHYTPGGRSVAQRDLTLAWQGGYLGKVAGRVPNACDIYVVSPSSPRGLAILQDLLGAEEVKRRLRRPAALDHALAVNGLRARVEISARDLGFDLPRWLDELDMEDLAKGGIVPDAFFEILRQDGDHARRSGFCVEVEVDSVSRSHWQRRLDAYANFYVSGQYERQFRLRSFRLLVVTQRSDRQIQRLLADAADLNFGGVRVASWEVVRETPPAELLLAPIWQKPLVEEPVSLFDARSEE
jgi:hypothetical protein